MNPRIALLVTLLAASSAWAAVPGRIHVNGALSDADDRPVDGERSVRFSLYSQETGGEAFFTETLPVRFHKGAFFAELGGTTPLDLDLLVAAKDSVWLGVAVGEDEELSPRLRMGSVPLSAYAHRAGSAAVADLATEATHAAEATRADSAARADVATTAETLAGEGADAYRKADEPISFADLVDVPAGLADGDDDLFATLKCLEGQAAIFDGTQWNCASPFADKRCLPGMVVTGIDAAGNLECAVDKDTNTDTDTKYSGADFALSNKACTGNRVVRGIDEKGEPVCADVALTDTTYTAKAQGGIVIAGTEISLLQDCSPGKILKADVDGRWTCENDRNDDTTYNGNNFAISGQSCSAGVMVGINADGTVQCSSDPIRSYVNSKCHLYVGWSDNCATCNVPSRWVKVSNDGCSFGSGSCLTSTIMGGTSLRVGRFNFDGKVDDNDRMFFAFRCD